VHKVSQGKLGFIYTDGFGPWKSSIFHSKRLALDPVWCKSSGILGLVVNLCLHAKIGNKYCDLGLLHINFVMICQFSYYLSTLVLI